MSYKFILAFLKISVTILYYFLIVVTIVFVVTSILNLMGGDTKPIYGFNNKNYNYEVTGLGAKSKEPSYTYSKDSLVRYHEVSDRYMLQVEAHSAFGFYALITRFLFLCLGISILWNFKKIFGETKLDNPFKYNMVKRLKILALLFIFSDVLKLIDYILFNNLLRRSVANPHFGLNADIGDGIITGMIILLIAVVYQRGIALQEENALTV
jgi:hypothetical protein